jgi:hypothetical protein
MTWFFANIAIIVLNEECLVAMTQPCKPKLGKIYILGLLTQKTSVIKCIEQ